MSHPLQTFFKLIVYAFAVIGFVLVVAYTAVQLGWTKTSGIIDNQHDYFKKQLTNGSPTVSNGPEAWNTGEEWQILKEAILKDRDAVTKASSQAKVSPRLVVSLLVVEQLRLFHSNRELFKQVFAPLKILAIQSQFSWGVMGVKQETARQIEANLLNPKSDWYITSKESHLLNFTTSDHDSERFARLTDEDNRYYSYLYAAIFLRQIQSQWSRAGFPIDSRPEILATLYDLGFEKSKPHANPLSGGAEIEIATTTYSFGRLAESFYNSNELLSEFPR